jgi:hypothetical protein
MADIELDEEYYSALGTFEFSGVLDGHGKTVNLKNTSIFHTLTGTVMNLKIGGSIKNVPVGGPLAVNNSGKIADCVSTASISAGNNSVGGFVSENSGFIDGCVRDGRTSGYLCAGGICVYNLENGVISNCSNKNTVFGGEVGGICVIAEGSSQIMNCQNIGNVISTGGIGGAICGTVQGESEVKNCVNTGKVCAQEAA